MWKLLLNKPERRAREASALAHRQDADPAQPVLSPVPIL